MPKLCLELMGRPTSGIITTQAPQNGQIHQWIAALQPGSAVIAPIFSDYGTVVFILTAETQLIKQSQVMVLPKFSRKDLYDMTRGEKKNGGEGYLQAYWDWTGETDAGIRQVKHKAWQHLLTINLDKLRDVLLKPILARLHELGIHPGATLLWLPDSDISLLPVHTALIEGKPILARYTIQFAPSLYTAYTSQKRFKGKKGERLLALINPTEDLDYSPIEGLLISRFFEKKTILSGIDGSRAKFNHALTTEPTYLHLSTHGSYEWLTPLESGLELARGERLTLGNILSKPDMLYGTRLVVLSACETGLIDINASAEALGLPSAFLQAGVSGVISTLWMVNDISTTFLMGKFYQLHIEEGRDPSKALALAQEWLRTASYKDLRDWLILYMAEETSPQFLQMVHVLDWLRSMAMKQATKLPYQEPYYWAGFMYYGM